jgi:hypothetical protein
MVENEVFCSMFSANAKLVQSMESVKMYLDKMGYLKQDSTGTKELIYRIVEGKEPKLLKLEDDRITLKFSYYGQNSGTHNSGLLTFLSLIKMLQQFYEINLDSIYDYVVEALDKNWSIEVKNEKALSDNLLERIESLNDSNCDLANQIVLISKHRAKAIADNRIYKEFCKIIIENLKKNFKPEELPHFFILLGIDRNSLKSIEDSLK